MAKPESVPAGLTLPPLRDRGTAKNPPDFYTPAFRGRAQVEDYPRGNGAARKEGRVWFTDCVHSEWSQCADAPKPPAPYDAAREVTETAAGNRAEYFAEQPSPTERK